MAAAIGPVVLAGRITKKHWINIPIWDEWDTPGQALLHYAQGTLTWADLFAQHNESRKVVPRLIHIGIASFAGWDVRHGMALTFLCACTASAWSLARLRKQASLSQTLFPWLLINLILFVPSQYENFLSGFAFEIFIPFVCLFGCCAVNLSRWPLLAKAVCNSSLGLLSTYTFAHGLLLWPFAIPLPNREERSRKPSFFVSAYALYLIVGAIAIAGYFAGYRRPDFLPPPATFAQAGQVFDFLLVWIGAPLQSPLANARLTGALAMLVIVAALAGTIVVLRKNKDRWRAYYPWLLVLAFALASGLVTAVGRVNIGVDSVFNTSFLGFSGMRYNVTAVFAYVAVIGLFSVLYQDLIHPQAGRRRNFLVAVSGCSILLAAVWIGMFRDEWTRVKQFQANRKRARTAVIWSKALPNNPELFLAYPYVTGFPPRVEEMRAAGLLQLPVVSDLLRDAVQRVPTAARPESGHLDACDPLPPAYFRFAGWVRDPVKETAADYVVLGWEDAANSFHPFTAIPTGIVRPDLKMIYGPASFKAGFDQDIETARLPSEATVVRGWAIDWEGQAAFPLEGSVRLDQPRSLPTAR